MVPNVEPKIKLIIDSCITTFTMSVVRVVILRVANALTTVVTT